MVTTVENLNERYPAVAESASRARRAVAAFAPAGLSGSKLEMLRLAVSEAVTNVVVHAYPGGSGTVEVTAAVASGELWVLVSDDGCGYQTPAQNPGLGMGLAFMAHACDDFVIAERAEGGTEARMLFLLDEMAPPASER